MAEEQTVWAGRGPLDEAWEAYKKTEGFGTLEIWATHDKHIKRSLRAAFEAGWAARLDWQSVENIHPPRHTVSRVWHPELGQFDATPCYGMHAPWWVPRNGATEKESEPLPMAGTFWAPVPAPPG